ITDSGGNYTLNDLPAGAATITATATGFQSGSVSITVVAGTTVTAPNITLAPGTGAVSGTVNDSSGAPVAGASVGFGGGSTTTNAAGGYTLSGIPVGTIQLVASASGFQSSTQNVTIQGGVTATANFTLSPPASTGTVTGKVTNISTGGVISGATVSWSGGSSTANSSGIYVLNNVTAGSQTITATATGYLTRSA